MITMNLLLYAFGLWAFTIFNAFFGWRCCSHPKASSQDSLAFLGGVFIVSAIATGITAIVLMILFFYKIT